MWNIQNQKKLTQLLTKLQVEQLPTYNVNGDDIKKK